MIDKLVIRSKDQLWNDIIVEGLKANVGRDYMRDSLIDAIRNEMIDQIKFRMRVEDIDDIPHTPKNEKVVENIMKQAVLKWRSLIRECNKWTQTVGLIREEDLDRIHLTDEEDEDGEWPDAIEAMDDSEDTGDWDGDEKTAEWPEDSVVIDEKTAEWLKMRGADLDGLSDGPFEPKRESWTP